MVQCWLEVGVLLFGLMLVEVGCLRRPRRNVAGRVIRRVDSLIR